MPRLEESNNLPRLIGGKVDEWVRDTSISLPNFILRIVRQLNSLADGRVEAANSAGTAAPVGGTWAVGDWVRNSSPSDLGGYALLGWICTVSGSPGTWLPVTVNVTGTQKIYRPLRPNAAILPASNAAAYAETAGTNFPVPGLAFDTTTTEYAYWFIKAVSYGGSPVLKILWYSDTQTSGDVVWACAIAAITPDTDSQDVETKAFPVTAQSVTDSHLGTTGQRVHTCSITISNLDSIATGDYVAIRVYRNTADSADTMSGDAILVDATLEYAVG